MMEACNFVTALAGVKKSAGNKIIGGEFVWGQEHVIYIIYIPSSKLLKMKISQNNE
jgi:hypothetical protein